MSITWFDHLYFTIIAIVIPYVGLHTAKTSVEDTSTEVLLPPKKHIYYSNSLLLLIGALIVLTLWNVYYRPFSLLGIDYPYVDNIVLLLSTTILMLYFIDTLFGYFYKKKTKKEMKDTLEIMPSNWSEYKHYILLAFAAGICEEIIFRGFLITYIRELMHNHPYSFYVALLLPSISFAVSHIYQGWLAVLKIFVLSILFGAVFILSKSLALVIVIHIFVDLFSGALLVKIAQKLN
jgi:uncharacterized protein